MKFYKFIATVAGIGYIGKGGGTVAAIASCIMWLLIPAGKYLGCWQVITVLLITVLGVWSGNKVNEVWGKDSNKVVIDEVAGMMVTLLFVPAEFKYILAGLVLFRFFDIAKPLMIREMEKLPKGWGVMGDDLLAGFYAQMVLQLIVHSKIL